MFHIAICDDVRRDREELCRVLKDELKAFDADARFLKFGSGNALLDAWEKSRMDIQLVFLDIYMEGIDGIETARRLRSTGYRGIRGRGRGVSSKAAGENEAAAIIMPSV